MKRSLPVVFVWLCFTFSSALQATEALNLPKAQKVFGKNPQVLVVAPEMGSAAFDVFFNSPGQVGAADAANFLSAGGLPDNECQ